MIGADFVLSQLSRFIVMPSFPEIEVEVLELRDLKHNGGHKVEVTFLGKTSRSQFIDGYGSFKPIRFSTSFPLTETQALSSQFWELNNIYITVIHERLLTEDKIVGDSSVPIKGARDRSTIAGHGDWIHLRYKGENRGSVKVRIIPNKDVPTPAISATVTPVSTHVIPPIHRVPLVPRAVPRTKSPIDRVSSDWPS